jgi:Flp pilus assembly protein TadG
MRSRQNGATTVEFALALLMFLMVVFAIIDFSRMLYTWNAANETTREGARYAVVCADPSSDTRVLAKMQALMPAITAINVTWEPAGCNASSCEAVTVSLTGMNFNFVSPLPGTLGGTVILLPGFSTYLPREMMSYNALIC